MRTIKVGTSPSKNDFFVKDDLVSEIHIRLVVNDNGQVTVIDSGSTNGTFVNGTRVNEKILDESDELVIGSTKIPWKDYVKESPTVKKTDDVTSREPIIRSKDSFPTIDSPVGNSPADVYYSQRSKNWMISIGILFLIFVLMPVKFGDRIIFLNFEVFGSGDVSRGVPDVVKLILILPLFMGIALFVFSSQKRNLGISTAVLAFGVLPFLILMTDRNLSSLMQFTGSNTGMGLNFIIGSLTFIGLLGGSFAVMNRPGNKMAHQIILAGAILFFVQIVIPTKGIDGKYTLGIIQAFELLAKEDPTGKSLFLITGLTTLLTLGLGVTSALYGIRFFRKDIDPYETAKNVFVYYLWCFVPVVILGLYALTMMPRVPDLNMMLLMFIKMMSFIAGLVLIIPVGFAEVINSVDEAREKPVK